MSAYACNKIYLADKLWETGLRFDESIRFAEDVSFTVAYCGLCACCVLLPDKLYHYWQNEESIMHQYHKDSFSLHLLLFKTRLPLIRADELEEYCDIWFYQFSHLFSNIFDARNGDMSFWEKMRYNQRMIKTEEFRFCLDHGSLQKENPLLVKMLRHKNSYAYWAIEKAARIKNRTGGAKQ